MNTNVGMNSFNQSEHSRSKDDTMSDITYAFYEKYHIGEISAITGMLSLSIQSIITIFLFDNSSTNSIELSVLYNGFGMLFISLVIPLLGGNQRILFVAKDTKPYNTAEWISLLVIAILSVVMVSIRFLALKYAGATIESLIFTSEIVFAYAAQVILFGSVPAMLSIIGSLCIVIACFIVPFEKAVIAWSPKGCKPFL